MPRIALIARPARVRMLDVAAVAGAAAYVVLVSMVITGEVDTWARNLVFVPPALIPLAVFRRRPLTPTQASAIGLTTLLLVAVLLGFVAIVNWFALLLIPMMAVTAVFVARFPAATILTLVLFSGAFGSLQALAGIPAPKLVDPLLGGLWLAALWIWLSGRSRDRVFTSPGVVILFVYALITAGGILAAYNATAGLQSFRGATWYMGAAVLVAYAPWSDRTGGRILRGMILLTAVVGGYAALRWAIGPAGAERDLALQAKNNVLAGELRPTGSFATSKELSAWMAIVIPFLTAMVLVRRDRWRLVALVGVGACITAMAAADVRAGPAAAGTGVAVVFILFQFAQGFRGHRGPAVAIAVAVAVLLGGGAFALTLADKADSGRRYKAIVDPASDDSYQARLFKWRSAIDDIESAPFGHGLGTAGRVQKRYGEFRNLGSIDVDNSYLKVAYEQGFFMMALLGLGFLLLLAGLARRSITTLDPARAGPAIAASGTMVAMLVTFFVGEYIEGLQVLAGWCIVGIGLRQFTLRPRSDTGPTPAAA